jgi:hypothetical protein
VYRLALLALKALNSKYFISGLANAIEPLGRVRQVQPIRGYDVFGKKKIKEKKFIDYVLEDIPFELGDLLAMDQAFNSSNCLMRTAILGPEKGAIENDAITNAIKSA